MGSFCENGGLRGGELMDRGSLGGLPIAEITLAGLFCTGGFLRWWCTSGISGISGFGLWTKTYGVGAITGAMSSSWKSPRGATDSASGLFGISFNEISSAISSSSGMGLSSRRIFARSMGLVVILFWNIICLSRNFQILYTCFGSCFLNLFDTLWKDDSSVWHHEI